MATMKITIIYTIPWTLTISYMMAVVLTRKDHIITIITRAQGGKNLAIPSQNHGNE